MKMDKAGKEEFQSKGNGKEVVVQRNPGLNVGEDQNTTEGSDSVDKSHEIDGSYSPLKLFVKVKVT